MEAGLLISQPMGNGISRNGHRAKTSPNKTWNKTGIGGGFKELLEQTANPDYWQ